MLNFFQFESKKKILIIAVCIKLIALSKTCAKNQWKRNDANLERLSDKENNINYEC